MASMFKYLAFIALCILPSSYGQLRCGSPLYDMFYHDEVTPTCLRFFQLRSTWEAAQTDCLLEDSFLAEPNQFLQDQIITAIRTTYVEDGNYFLGIQNTPADHTYRYVNFNAGDAAVLQSTVNINGDPEPDMENVQNCGCDCRPNFTFCSCFCGDPHYYICQNYNLIPVTE